MNQAIPIEKLQVLTSSKDNPTTNKILTLQKRTNRFIRITVKRNSQIYHQKPKNLKSQKCNKINKF